jgi:DNA-directed RNA polymerase alpha subunit
MKELNLNVYEPGDIVGTMSKDGKVAVFTVGPDGALVPSDNRMFATGLGFDDPIEALNLTVRTYNVLKREGVHTVGQMVSIFHDKGVEGLERDYRNMGAKGSAEVAEHVQRLEAP